jgi:hypothetical protein
LSTAYLCFYVCDQMWTMSGVVACVTLGVLVNAFGKSMINDPQLMGNYLTLVRVVLMTGGVGHHERSARFGEQLLLDSFG